MGDPEDPVQAGPTAVDEVLAANEAFYAAVEAGDLDGLRAVWTDEEGSVCIHPGATAIHGTAAALRSWALVMASTDYIQFFLTDVEVTVAHGHRGGQLHRERPHRRRADPPTRLRSAVAAPAP